MLAPDAIRILSLGLQAHLSAIKSIFKVLSRRLMSVRSPGRAGTGGNTRSLDSSDDPHPAPASTSRLAGTVGTAALTTMAQKPACAERARTTADFQNPRPCIAAKPSALRTR